MSKYVIKRILSGMIAIIISITINFVLIRMVPGDPIQIISGIQNPNPEMILTLKSRYGLDKPLYMQYLSYLNNVLHGNLGYSYSNNQPVSELILNRAFPTLTLVIISLLLAILMGVFFGIFSAIKKDSILGKAVNFFSYLLSAIPSFILGIALIMFFAITLHLFPTSGMYDLRADYSGFEKYIDLAYHMFLPVLTIVLIESSAFCKVTRASVLDTLAEDYVTTLIATGISSRKRTLKYILKNAMLPVMSIIAISLSYLITGVTLVEIVFSWPGMGRLIFDSIAKRDYLVISGIFLILSIFIVLIMLLLDVVYCILDKRIYISIAQNN